MRLRKQMNKIMSSVASSVHNGSNNITSTVRNSLSSPSSLAAQEAAKSKLVSLTHKLSAAATTAGNAAAGTATVLAIGGSIRGGKGKSNDHDDYDGDGNGETQSNSNGNGGVKARVLQRLVGVGVGGTGNGIRKNQKKGSRWQLLEEVSEEDEDEHDQGEVLVPGVGESEIEQDNDDELEPPLAPWLCVVSDYSQISTNARTSKAGSGAQWPQEQQHTRTQPQDRIRSRQAVSPASTAETTGSEKGDSLPAASTSYCLLVPELQSRHEPLDQDKDEINTELNRYCTQAHHQQELQEHEENDLNSAQTLHQIVLEGISTLLCNHERLDLLLEAVNEEEQRAAAGNEFAIKTTTTTNTAATSIKDYVAGALRRKLRRVTAMTMGRRQAYDDEENSIATSTNHHRHHFDVKQSKLIKSGEDADEISPRVVKQSTGKRSMRKRMSLFRRKLKPSPVPVTSGNVVAALASTSNAIKSDAVLAVTQIKSKKKVIVKGLQKSGKQVGKALKSGFMAMGNSMIPAHYIVPSSFEVPGSFRTTANPTSSSWWEDEARSSYNTRSHSTSKTPYWTEYEMYDQYEDDRRKYEVYYQEYVEKRRREQHA